MGKFGSERKSRSRDSESSSFESFKSGKPKRSGSRDSGRGGRDSERFGRSDRNSGRGRRDSDRQSMHKVVCDKCGKDCEVPFKPTSNKPIYCSDCFRKEDNRGSSNSGVSQEDIELINKKLDSILKLLKK